MRVELVSHNYTEHTLGRKEVLLFERFIIAIEKLASSDIDPLALELLRKKLAESTASLTEAVQQGGV